jgi:branched-chain amino acid transport system ATP-binding protein
MSAPLLHLDDIHTYYADSHVLQGVSFDVCAGEVVGLMGRNGAGKSTTLKSIMGIARARRGRVVLSGRELSGWPIHRVAGAGVAYVPETRDVFPSLSTRENLALGAAGNGDWTLERVLALFPQLAGLLSRPSAVLSGGEQQMLAIGRALLGNPRCLLLDEPTEGLAPRVVEDIRAALLKLKAAGLAMLVVDHDIAFAASFADRVVVLGKGQVRWLGSGHDFADAAEVKRAWLGL